MNHEGLVFQAGAATLSARHAEFHGQRERLSEAEIEKLAAQGAAWSEDRAIEEALKV